MEDILSFFTPLNKTLIILAITSFFFIQGKIRADLVALCSLISLILFNVLKPNEALAGFSNPVLIMMVGLFVVGAGIFRTGLAKMISTRILRLSGNNENLLLVLIMLTTAFVGAFVSNTGTVAVMMPIIISMAAEAKISPSRYLMPLAFASSMGMFTLISTPPNLVIQEALVQGGFEPLKFFSFAPIGFVAVTVGIILMLFLSKLLVSKENSTDGNKKAKSMKELIEEYNLTNQTYRIKVSANSPIVSSNLKELNIPTQYGINISKVIHHIGSRFRKAAIKEVANSNTIILADDVLFCYGEKEKIDEFIAKNDLTLLPEESSMPEFSTSGIAEAVIMPNSNLINRSIVEINFREEYNLNVLGIQRHNEYLMQDIKDIHLHSGDALLIQGTWANITNISRSDHYSDLVILGQPLEEAAKVTLDQKAPIAATIMILMVLAMVFNVMASVTAVLLAAALMVLTGCLRSMEEAYKNINWESIILIGSMLPMATAFEKTGAATMISNILVNNAGALGSLGLLAGIYLCTSLLTMVISNTATAVLFTPIAMQAAKTMGISPYPMLFAVAVAASMCFASPFATPPNALVMSAGRYTFMDYIRVGLPLQVVMGIIMVFIIPLIFPF